MPDSPTTFLKRVGIWSHVRGRADRYQAGVHHAHGEELAETPAGEIVQNNWPDPDPDKKGVERADLPS